MKKVHVYAYENKDAQGRYRIINMPGTNRPMLFPFSRKEILSNGVWTQESGFYRELRRMAHNAAAPSSLYSDDEKKGRTDAQARCSEIFEQSFHCPREMPLLKGDGTLLERIIVVEMDLDNINDIQPVTPAVNERWLLQGWVAKRRDDFLCSQSEKKVALDNATEGKRLSGDNVSALAMSAGPGPGPDPQAVSFPSAGPAPITIVLGQVQQTLAPQPAAAGAGAETPAATITISFNAQAAPQVVLAPAASPAATPAPKV